MKGRIRLAAARTSSTRTATAVFEEVTPTSINCGKTKWIGVAPSPILNHGQGHYRVGGWGYVEMGYPRPGSHRFSDVFSNCALRAGYHRGARFSGSDGSQFGRSSRQGLGSRPDFGQ